MRPGLDCRRAGTDDSTFRSQETTLLKLSAFADEISPELDEQIRVCREVGVTHMELRNVRGVNVLDFDNDLRAEIGSKLRDNGMGVVCIGSPIGKVKISDPWPAHFDRFKIAVELAEYFEAPYVRIFSYYPPEAGGDMAPHRDEVVRRMNEKVEYVSGRNLTLLHENEKGIFGDRGGSCFELIVSVNSPKLRCAFDFANYIQVGESPLANWRHLKPYTVHIHIKDARFKDGKIMPPGQGDGQIGKVIADAYASGYRGFLTLEPHLAADGQFSGFSGPDLFKKAADALKLLCRKHQVPLAGVAVAPPADPALTAAGTEPGRVAPIGPARPGSAPSANDATASVPSANERPAS
jgi:sugar phosphate isomerase/epimerase